MIGRTVGAKSLCAMLLAGSLASCGEARPAQVARPCAQSITWLFFGTQMPSGVVTDLAWKQFVADSLVHALPNGFTVLDAQGSWLSPAGTRVDEASHVVVVIGAGSQDIERLRAEYRTKFHQQSVLRIETCGGVVPDAPTNANP
jgi:hypothetical protein